MNPISRGRREEVMNRYSGESVGKKRKREEKEGRRRGYNLSLPKRRRGN